MNFFRTARVITYEKDYYICDMKSLLSILSLFILFLTGQEIMTLNFCDPLPENNVIVTSENEASSLQSKLENFELAQIPHYFLCTSNRTQQGIEANERLFKTTNRLFDVFIQKGQNTLNKVEETLSVTHILKFSSLRMRSGHWVYVLRKIII